MYDFEFPNELFNKRIKEWNKNRTMPIFFCSV